MAVTTYTKSGTKATTAAKLDKTIFALEVKNHELLKQAYVAYLSNAREASAVTKTRGLVSGGGKKPWKQKGTGRARFGSSRNPIWRGGGIVFGPTGLENYTKKLPTQTKRLAIRQALSLAADAGKISVIEGFDMKDGKTAAAVTLFNKLGVSKNTVIVVDTKTDDVMRATNNLPKVKVVQARYVNVYDTLNADHIIITSKALVMMAEWLGGTK
ncbi:50S ribosomal protein L4 [Candidatus Saccharibacteria bacterium]|nr:50S ribosomal protein L4 [Candidatus Saccharibacteria bacterium]